MTNRALFVASFLSLTVLLAPQAGYSVGSESENRPTPSTASRTPSDYSLGKAAVEAGNYETAIGHLTKAVAANPRDADALNYLGYCTRKLGRYDESMTWYSKALVVDPRHRGALEYQGELFLTLGNVGGAEANLAQLDAICTFGCDEYDELKAAIAAHAGGRQSSAKQW